MAATQFCTRCDGYGVVLPVGSRTAATCPECDGMTADRPEHGPHYVPDRGWEIHEPDETFTPKATR